MNGVLTRTTFSSECCWRPNHLKIARSLWPWYHLDNNSLTFNSYRYKHKETRTCGLNVSWLPIIKYQIVILNKAILFWRISVFPNYCPQLNSCGKDLVFMVGFHGRGQRICRSLLSLESSHHIYNKKLETLTSCTFAVFMIRVNTVNLLTGSVNRRVTCFFLFSF